jgi:lysozyme
MSEELKKQLIRHEGLKRKVYKDSEGYLTIGVGRNLQGNGMSIDECLMLLDNDIKKCDAQIRAVLPWTASLDPARFDVLMNMCFNLGVDGLLKWRPTLQLIERGEYDSAADKMLAQKWARQVGQRAVELASQLRTGQYQNSK